MSGPPTYDRLVAEVHGRAASADAADLLEAAVQASAEHATTADRLLDHFVAHARGNGMSWTDIGSRLGVSKQAARQRFTSRVGALPFAAAVTPRLQACLDRAEQEARSDGAAAVGTEHLLAGLLAEGVGASILERLHVDAEAVRAASHRLFGPPNPATADTPPMSTEATCALDAAATSAMANATGGHQPDVRTEHLLGALALDPGSRARRVLAELGVDIGAVKRELQCYVTIQPGRPARWWKRRPASQPTCSFCGRTGPDSGQLVNGPGVAICAGCVALATDILDRRPSA